MREVRRGGIVELWCRFKKHNANGSVSLVDPTSINVEISNPQGTVVSSYTYGVQGNLSRQARGVYRLDYPVPLTAEADIWTDTWTGVHGGVQIEVGNSFNVLEEYAFVGEGTSVLRSNMLYSIVFDQKIADPDGASIGTTLYYIFSTTLTPMYTTVNAVRNNYGTYLNAVSDLSIALLIHDSSIEVDAIMPVSTMPTNPDRLALLQMAMYKYTLCSTSHKLLGELLSIHGGSKRSRLGDLDISYGPGMTGIQDDWKDAEKCKDKWMKVLESMGQYLDVMPASAVDRGLYSADRLDIGRTIDPSMTDAMGANSSAYRLSLINGNYGRRPVRTWMTNPGAARRSY